MKPLKGNERWINVNGKIVTIDRKDHRLQVTILTVRRPYNGYVISVFADPIDKQDEDYLRIKEIIKDDWMIDVLEAEDDTYMEVFLQCFPIEVAVEWDKPQKEV
jgi:hypothetical protein